MIDQEREDYRQAISLLLGALDPIQRFPRDKAVHFAWEVMERYCAADDSPEGQAGQEDAALRRGGGSDPAPPGLIDGTGADG